MIGSAAEVAAAIRSRQTFILTSHARPDGDAIGSPMALAFALDALGKTSKLISRDPVPDPYRWFPGVDRIQVGSHAMGPADAAVLLECSDLSRPDVVGLDQFPLINIDHHPGNKMYGAVNWFDETAAACGEMVADLIDALGVRWTRDIATHIYLAVSTDTGCFRYGHITPKTFDICRRVAETGVSPADLAREIFDSFGIGRVKLTGAMLGAMELHSHNRVALLAYDDELLSACGATVSDTEGLVNLPLGARDVLVVALFKRQPFDVCRVSLRSKGAVDVRAIAARWGGGGHTNAAGCTVAGPFEEAKAHVLKALTDAVEQRP